MVTITFNIPNSKAQRLSDALVSEGYVFNPDLGTTDAQQRKKFVERMTVDFWKGIVFNYERSVAIANEPDDTAALQAQRFVGFDDVTSSTV
jgi:hypothetical protein